MLSRNRVIFVLKLTAQHHMASFILATLVIIAQSNLYLNRNFDQMSSSVRCKQWLLRVVVVTVGCFVEVQSWSGGGKKPDCTPPAEGQPGYVKINGVKKLNIPSCGGSAGGLYLVRTRCHAIAKITARCAQYMSALKIVCNVRFRRGRKFVVLVVGGRAAS